MIGIYDWPRLFLAQSNLNLIYHKGRKLTNNMPESALLPKPKAGRCTTSTFHHFYILTRDFTKGQGFQLW